MSGILQLVALGGGGLGIASFIMVLKLTARVEKLEPKAAKKKKKQIASSWNNKVQGMQLEETISRNTYKPIILPFVQEVSKRQMNWRKALSWVVVGAIVSATTVILLGF